jgi:hypothetical protein
VPWLLDVLPPGYRLIGDLSASGPLTAFVLRGWPAIGAGWPVMAAMRSKSLWQWRMTCPASAAVAAMSRSGMEG